MTVPTPDSPTSEINLSVDVAGITINGSLKPKSFDPLMRVFDIVISDTINTESIFFSLAAFVRPAIIDVVSKSDHSPPLRYRFGTDCWWITTEVELR
jgi:hypothetical protein